MYKYYRYVPIPQYTCSSRATENVRSTMYEYVVVELLAAVLTLYMFLFAYIVALYLTMYYVHTLYNGHKHENRQSTVCPFLSPGARTLHLVLVHCTQYRTRTYIYIGTLYRYIYTWIYIYIYMYAHFYIVHVHRTSYLNTSYIYIYNMYRLVVNRYEC